MIAGELRRDVVSQCTYRCVVLPDGVGQKGYLLGGSSQCTYRCVVLPDWQAILFRLIFKVSMHLQVRGAP